MPASFPKPANHTPTELAIAESQLHLSHLAPPICLSGIEIYSAMVFMCFYLFIYLFIHAFIHGRMQIVVTWILARAFMYMALPYSYSDVAAWLKA